MKQVRGHLLLGLVAVFLLWQAAIGVGFDRAIAIFLLAGWFGVYGWLRFTQSGKRFFATVEEMFKGSKP